MVADGCSPSPIQAEGNRQYRLLKDQEWDVYQKIAENANNREDNEAKSKEAQVKRLISRIQANVRKRVWGGVRPILAYVGRHQAPGTDRKGLGGVGPRGGASRYTAKLDEYPPFSTQNRHSCTADESAFIYLYAKYSLSQ